MSGPRLVKFVLVAAVFAVSTSLVALYSVQDPSSSPLFPKCIFFSITGLKCPGCGSQRAVHQLLNGNLMDAVRYNALLVAAIPYLALYLILKLLEAFLPRTANGKIKNPPYLQADPGIFTSVLSKVEKSLYHGFAVYVVLILVLSFWLLRNIIGF